MPGGRDIFTPSDAIYRGPIVSPRGPASLLIVDYLWACEDELVKQRVQNGHAIEIVWPNLANTVSDRTELPSGAYMVSSYDTTYPGSTIVAYDDMGPFCELNGLGYLPQAVDGTVFIDGKQPGGPVTGTLDVSFADGEHLIGQFNATLCPALEPKVGSQNFAGKCAPPLACTPSDAGSIGTADADSPDAMAVIQCQ
jgi:hypothetical protein